MRGKLLALSPLHWRYLLLAGLALACLGSVALFGHFHQLVLLLIPLGVAGGLVLMYDYRLVFYALVASIPFSIQLELGAAALDVPSEPLMILLTIVFLIRLCAGKQFTARRGISAFHFWIFLLLFWTFYTTLLSTHPLRSLKFLLAKIWYLASFVYMAEQVLQDRLSIKRLVWAFLLPLMGVVVVVTFRHALEGFSFESSHLIAYPLFPNGVVYGACLALALPLSWYARSWYSPRSFLWYLCWIATGLLLLGIVLCYKRGAWLAVLLLPLVVFLVKRGWFSYLIYLSLVATTLFVGYLVKDNNFYQFAPIYDQTFFHHGDISGHLSATFEGRELSSVERFYRWVAAKNMVAEKPLVGFGPSTFNQNYRQYADDAFRTYVSDNPEQSTTHNYFLMTFTEQGVVGGFLFLGLCVFMLLKAHRLYHLLEDPELRTLLLMFLLSLITVLFHAILNELIEVDKVGPMFWLSFAIIHKIETWHEQTTQQA